jgi:hypothetical protein
MWRRVPCEQPLHTGQSILSPRRKPMMMVAGCLRASLATAEPRPSGERESGSYSGTRLRDRSLDPRIDAVTRKTPEMPSGAPGRVFFSV